MSIKDAAKIAGVHINTAQKWDSKKRKVKAELELANLDGAKVRKKEGGVQADHGRRLWMCPICHRLFRMTV
jgi:transposase